MYSSLMGAKKCAKQLNHILYVAGVDYSLARCQAAVAKSGGYRDWHDLNKRIGARTDTDIPYDYWGKLLQVLPEPCRAPVAWHLDAEAVSRPEGSLPEEWIRAVLPYAIGLEGIHRSRSPILQPGTGKGQKLRLGIISSILLNMGGGEDIALRLHAETLTVTAQGEPRELLPGLTSKPGFETALAAVTAAGIIAVENGLTRVLPPSDPELRGEILERAREWNIQKMPKINYVEADPKLGRAIQLQIDLDREQAGPKAPYDELDYRGVQLSSRFSVLSEFNVMQRAVDEMSEPTRLRIASIWCDSRACADYQVEVKLGMYRDELPEELRENFLAATNGFNGLSINHGSKSKRLDCCWPADDAHYANIEFPESLGEPEDIDF